MTLVLLVTTTLLTMVITWMPQQPQVAERAFWPAWQRLWTSGRERVLASQTQLRVRIESERHRVVLETKTGQVIERLNIPPTLRLIRGRSLLVIYASGSGRSQTLWWQSSATSSLWKQTFQLGGAIFYVTQQRSRLATAGCADRFEFG
ncbi:hypothetical protein FD13_GL001376 [Levilactobacillus senmaizukei DSM 21775 = NBRC 103853]|uniref:Uncharacterized protein n=2 Tax=Levilactobacillus senmaizukei TaxID=431273 RepID=A0A0R2DCP1_9LACO|nr:hypothetical protein FD13_GL001376 [Levilactobacillus senmaizukei DSM 21775 = NBRC 103853]